MSNTLFYGDNLTILREHVHAESVDLIYLDPPFNSNRDYNVLFREQSGEPAQAQIKAFTDTWKWSERAYHDFCQECQRDQLVKFVQSFVDTLGRNDVTAYLLMMAPRLLELHRVLKPTGSLYLHCDPTAAHYLKLLLDVIFGPANFRNEIIWKRRHGFSSAVHESNRFGTCTDILLFYAKSKHAKFTPQYNKESPEYQEYVRKFFTLYDESGRRYQATSLTNPAYRPNLIYEYKGYQPPANGWMITKEKMEQWDSEGRIHFPATQDGRLRRKSYAEELKGMPIQNLWDDIQQIGAHASERMHYPTQKPLPLLERILNASSKPGDIVLDPFCGCGTAVIAAQKMGRTWLGIDITHIAISLIKTRLADSFPEYPPMYAEVNIPTTDAEARALALQDRYEFQKWAVSLVPRAYPYQDKKGADNGIDGILRFQDDGSEPKRCVIQVKSGGVGSPLIRDFRGVIEREKAILGLFISLDPPTNPMTKESDSVGFYTTPLGNRPIQRLQMRTVNQLISGQSFDIPRAAEFFGVRQAMAIQLDSGQQTLDVR